MVGKKYVIPLKELMVVNDGKNIPLEALSKTVKVIKGESRETSVLIEELERRGINYSFVKGDYEIDMTKISFVYNPPREF